MSEAPERIEIESECGHANTYNSEDRRTWLHFPDNAPDYFYAEYVRADRIEELEAKLAKAVEALERIEDASKYFGNCPEASETTVRYAHETTRRLARTTIAELTGGKDGD